MNSPLGDGALSGLSKEERQKPRGQIGHAENSLFLEALEFSVDKFDLLYETINVDKKINLYHEKSLYDANNTTVINVINKYLSNFNNLMIVGHNPSITQFVNYISNATIDHVPSGGMAVIDFQENILDELTGELIDFIYPKKLKHT